MITKQEITHLASLAKLSLSDEEKETLTKEMGSIIDFAHKLEEADCGDIDAMLHAGDGKNVFREDEIKPSYKTSEILQNAPMQDEGCFIVPRTVE